MMAKKKKEQEYEDMNKDEVVKKYFGIDEKGRKFGTINGKRVYTQEEFDREAKKVTYD